MQDYHEMISLQGSELVSIHYCCSILYCPQGLQADIRLVLALATIQDEKGIVHALTIYIFSSPP